MALNTDWRDDKLQLHSLEIEMLSQMTGFVTIAMSNVDAEIMELLDSIAAAVISSQRRIMAP